MKNVKKSIYLIALAIMAALVSCNKEPVETIEGNKKISDGQIAFRLVDNKTKSTNDKTGISKTVSLPFEGDDEYGLMLRTVPMDYTAIGTKATPFSTTADILSESIGLVIMKADTEGAAMSAKTVFSDSPYTLTYNSSSAKFLPNVELWWPMAGKYMSFYAWLPRTAVTLTSTDATAPTLAMEVEEDVDAQIDLMYSTPVEQYDTPSSSNDVTLTMNHAMTGLRFKAETGMVVTSVKIEGLYDEGTFDLSTGTWSGLAANGNEYEITTHTAHAVDDFDVFDDEFTMFVIPQTAPAGSLITVEIDGVTKTASLAGITLAQGILNTFTVGELPHPERQPLTFTALEDGTFTFTFHKNIPKDTTGYYKGIDNVSYSIDNGHTWVKTYNSNDSEISVTTPTILAGETVMWKGEGVVTAKDDYTFCKFSSTGNFNASGNILSMVWGDEVRKYNHIRSDISTCPVLKIFDNSKLVDASEIGLKYINFNGVKYCFSKMFYNCKSMTTPPELPETNLTLGCYSEMFYGCTALTTAPELPATNLASYCYGGMFGQCTSLTTAPELTATTMVPNCYGSMFSGCTSLITPPELPATTLASYCYYNMFGNCMSMTTAPELPATNIEEGCYQNMFHGCIAITTPPELPATTMKKYCYTSMFEGCNFVTPPELPATTLAEYCYQKMFQNSGITTPPELPATIMAPSCYSFMFYGCKKLTTAPVLASTSLASGCYSYMFSYCELITTPPELPATIMAPSCYSGMFSNCYELTTTPVLASTNLADGCYSSMFNTCTKLTTTPELPATILTANCYNKMFYGCTKLTTSTEIRATTVAGSCCREMFSNCYELISTTSELPAMTLAAYCYYQMYSSCQKLTTPPLLPATDIADYCYYGMFMGCSKLNTFQSILPATTLKAYCYYQMFAQCHQLGTAPELPALTLVNNCYSRMFYDADVNYVKAAFLTTPSTSYTNNWVYSVEPIGTFVKNVDATWDVSGNHGIPSGWTITTETF